MRIEMKSTHPIEQEELMAYLDGELEAERAGITATHLKRCQECQKLAADLRAVSQDLMEWELPPSDSQVPSELAAVLAEAKEPEKQKSLALRTRKTWREILKTRRYWGYSFAGAALGVILVLITAPRLRRDHLSSFSTPSSYAPAVGRPRSEMQAESKYADSFSNVDGNGSHSYDAYNYATSTAPNPPLPQQQIDSLASSPIYPSQP